MLALYSVIVNPAAVVVFWGVKAHIFFALLYALELIRSPQVPNSQVIDVIEYCIMLQASS